MRTVSSANRMARQQPANGGLPRTPVEVTVADLMSTAGSFDEAYQVLRLAIDRRLATVAALRDEISGRKRMPHRVQVEQALDELAQD